MLNHLLGQRQESPAPPNLFVNKVGECPEQIGSRLADRLRLARSGSSMHGLLS
jgi:hypothetical protein